MGSDSLIVFFQDLLVPGTGLAEKIIRPAAVYAYLGRS